MPQLLDRGIIVRQAGLDEREQDEFVRVRQIVIGARRGGLPQELDAGIDGLRDAGLVDRVESLSVLPSRRSLGEDGRGGRQGKKDEEEEAYRFCSWKKNTRAALQPCGPPGGIRYMKSG